MLSNPLSFPPLLISFQFTSTFTLLDWYWRSVSQVLTSFLKALSLSFLSELEIKGLVGIQCVG